MALPAPKVYGTEAQVALQLPGVSPVTSRGAVLGGGGDLRGSWGISTPPSTPPSLGLASCSGAAHSPELPPLAAVTQEAGREQPRPREG